MPNLHGLNGVELPVFPKPRNGAKLAAKFNRKSGLSGEDYFMKTYGHFIGGEHVGGQVGAFFSDVYEPMTGEVRCPVRRWPVTAELRCRRPRNAKAAQPAWAATNPQRRARGDDEVHRSVAPQTTTNLPSCSPASTARPSPDAKGDIQRGLEVCEFAARCARI